MGYIAPNSTLHIIRGIPFDPTYENTMYFTTAHEQAEWMLDHSKITLSALSYVRKGRGVIRVELTMAQLYDASYLMYRNESFENKWFYAFVDKVEYVNNVTTDIYFSIDLIQTWMMDFNFEQCLIEREHTTSDVLGEHIIDEGLEVGEIVSDGPISGGNVEFPPRIVLCTTFDVQQPTQIKGGELYPGRAGGGGAYYSGCQYEVFTLLPVELYTLESTLRSIVLNNRLNGVISLFMAPALGFDSESNTSTVISSVNSAIGNYTPHNRKLLTYPYNFLYVLSSSGDSHSFRYELFSDPTNIRFTAFGNASTNPGVILFANNYKGGDCYDETVTIDNMPLCAWEYDTFKAWLAQNAGSIAASFMSAFSTEEQKPQHKESGPYNWWSVHENAKGEKTWTYKVYDKLSNKSEEESGSNGGSKIKVDVGQLLQLGGKIIDEARKAPTMMGNGNGDLTYQCFGFQYFLMRKHLRVEVARIIDSYFDMYGYKTLRIGTPNLAARPCYTYVKTANCSMGGTIPADDKRGIEAIFDSGIRFWKKTALFGSYDYQYNNNRPT